jgi:hypothetical protein
MPALPPDMIDPKVRAAFDAFPPDARAGLLQLRRLILTVADETPGATPVEEATRWGEPAYLAPRGATIRLGTPKAGGFGLFVTCTTTLIDDFRTVAGDKFRFDGTRAVLFRDADDIDADALALLIRAALSYHQR